MNFISKRLEHLKKHPNKNILLDQYGYIYEGAFIRDGLGHYFMRTLIGTNLMAFKFKLGPHASFERLLELKELPVKYKFFNLIEDTFKFRVMFGEGCLILSIPKEKAFRFVSSEEILMSD